MATNRIVRIVVGLGVFMKLVMMFIVTLFMFNAIANEPTVISVN